MEPYVLRVVSRGKTPAAGRLEHLPKLWLHAPVRIELTCAAPDDTEASLDLVDGYALSIHSLVSRAPVDAPLLWYSEVSPVVENAAKTKGPHAIFELTSADIANITDAGEYWIALHAQVGSERIIRAAGYITFVADGFPDSPPTPTPPGTVYLTQAAGDARYVRDPGTVVDNRLVRWDGVSGNQVQSSLVTVGDDGSISTPATVTASAVRIDNTAFEGEITADLLTNDRGYDLPDANGTLALTANANGAPDRMELYVKCDEAGGVTTGQAVYIYGANGGNKLIRKAIASGESTSSKTLGFVSQALAHNAFGYVVAEGHVAVSIAKGAAVEGDPVWLSPSTAGGVVFGAAAKPSAPDHMVFMGYVTRITGANVTEIFVKVQNGFELEELHNVAISSPSTGHVLTWNGTVWVNSAPSGGGGGPITVTGNDGIGVTGSPGTAITLSLGAITPDSLDVTGNTILRAQLDVTGATTLRGTLVMIHDGDYDVAISAANLVEGGVSLYWPSSGGTLALVASPTGTINSSDIGDATPAGRVLLGAANAAAQRGALGLGGVALQGDGNKGSITVTASGATWTLNDGAVSNAKLASMLASTIKGSLVGGTPVDLTATETTSILNEFAGTIKGLVPVSAGGTASYLRADGSWSTPPGVPAGSGTELQFRNAGAPGAVTGSSVTGANIGLAGNLSLVNPTAAASGAQVASPVLTLGGAGWGTTLGTSQTCVWRAYISVVQGTTPTYTLNFEASLAGGAFSRVLALQAGGNGPLINGTGVRADFGQAIVGTLVESAAGNSGHTRIGTAPNGIAVRNDAVYSWSSTTDAGVAPDLILRRRGAANLQLGSTDAATPVAQTISAQSATGTNGSASGATFTLEGARGLGSGAGGDIRFRVAPAGGAGGTVANPFVDGLRVRAGSGMSLTNGGFASAGATDSLAELTVLKGVSVGSGAAVPLSETWGEKWVTATSYSIGARVYNNQGAYRCILAHTSGSTTEPGIGASWTSNWALDIRPGMAIPANTAGHALILVTGLSTAGDVARYMRQVSYKNVSGTSSMVGSEAVVGTDITATTALSVTVSDSTDTLEVACTGVSGQTWRWEAVILAAEMAIGS